MKTQLLAAVAIGILTAVAGPADRAVAEEPFELNSEQLDGVTAGLLLPAVQALRETAAVRSPVVQTDNAGMVFLNVEPVLDLNPPGLPSIEPK